MSWAELRDLVDALPEDSATKAAMAGDIDGRRWSQDTYALASIYNATLMTIRVLWAAHLKGSPPDMQAIHPPRLEADVEAAELRAAADERALAYIERYAPARAEQDAAEIARLEQQIRDLDQVAR
ncbi:MULTISPECIES: hypothetical protein [unclassified Streptomyces]|uniref:Uncharacterized protein n=1 Tax=Streptomyces bugieae TaxID=3098223 RepID=A0ABU7NKX3_9ACTN|nr:hypothetical protein [Streptomyces sp. DSM 41528]